MSNDLLGKLIEPDDNPGRDAIHVAIAPAEASRELKPGDRVGVGATGLAFKSEPHVGIVDPFLTEKIKKGQKFFIVLFPNTITSLRHVWEHPAFVPEPPPPDDSERAWAEDEAMKMGRTLEGLLNAIEGYEDGEDWIRVSEWERDQSFEIDWPRMWRYFERVKRLKVSDYDHVPFSCSC